MAEHFSTRERKEIIFNYIMAEHFSECGRTNNILLIEVWILAHILV